MTAHRFSVVDVFTRVALAGNPLAVFTNSEDLHDSVMQQIARELNLSETVFVQNTNVPGCIRKLRIFTPIREMVFAGHPTIGAAYILVKEGLVEKDARSFVVEEKIGPVAVQVERGEPTRLWLETPAIAFEEKFSASHCAQVLGLRVEELLDAQPQILNAGNPTLFVGLRTKRSVDRAVFDLHAFSLLREQYGTPFCMFVFTPTKKGAYSRMFGPDYGIPEDSATGSSTGPLAAFMKRHHLLSGGGLGRFVSEQGSKMGRRSLLYFDILPAEKSERILVGGYVTPLIEGTMTL